MKDISLEKAKKLELNEEWNFGLCGYIDNNNKWIEALKKCKINSVYDLLLNTWKSILNDKYNFDNSIFYSKKEYSPNDEYFKSINEFDTMTKIKFQWRNINLDSFRTCCYNLVLAFLGNTIYAEDIYSFIRIIEIRKTIYGHSTTFEIRFWLDKTVDLENFKIKVLELLNCKKRVNQLYDENILNENNIKISYRKDFDPNKKPNRQNKNFFKVHLNKSYLLDNPY